MGEKLGLERKEVKKKQGRKKVADKKREKRGEASWKWTQLRLKLFLSFLDLCSHSQWPLFSSTVLHPQGKKANNELCQLNRRYCTSYEYCRPTDACLLPTFMEGDHKDYFSFFSPLARLKKRKDLAHKSKMHSAPSYISEILYWYIAK